MFLVLIFPIYLLVGLTGIISNFSGMIIIAGIILVYKLYVSFDAFITSKKLNPYQLKPINKVWKYVLFAIIGYGTTWSAAMMNRKLIGYETFEIPSASMEPTINVGDKIMATKFKLDEIELGDVITFSRENGQTYLGRVVGLPNQEIKIQNDKAIYSESSEKWTETKISNDGALEYQEYKSRLPNGRTFETKKVLRNEGRDVPERENSNIEIQTVPQNKIFVVGDNRTYLMDSRTMGAINLNKVDKKVNYIWWSKSMERIGTKLDE